jgi:hypothetical protein
MEGDGYSESDVETMVMADQEVFKQAGGATLSLMWRLWSWLRSG